MLLAAVIVAAVLLLLKLPSPLVQPAEQIVVQLLPDEREYRPATEDVEPASETSVVPVEVVDTAIPVSAPLAGQTAEAAEIPRSATDWQEAIRTATSDTVAAMHRDESLRPGVAEAKRRAAINFAPSRAEAGKPIWENAETDYIGRKVLRAGDCYRVLEDSRATYQDIQRDLGQYIMFCDAAEDVVIGVDWVDDVKQKYAYLRHPDGEIPQAEIDAILRRPVVLAQE